MSLKSLTDHKLDTVVSAGLCLCALSGFVSTVHCTHTDPRKGLLVTAMLSCGFSSLLIPCHVIYSKSTKMYRCSKKVSCIQRGENIFKIFVWWRALLYMITTETLLCVANMVSLKDEISIPKTTRVVPKDSFLAGLE